MIAMDQYTLVAKVKCEKHDDPFADVVDLPLDKYTWFVEADKNINEMMFHEGFMAEQFYRVWQAIGYEVYAKLKMERAKRQRF